MINELSQNQENNAFYSKIKTQNVSSDEFQATLNDIKEEQKEDKSGFVNEDLDLSKARSNFENYAQAKVYSDGLKKVEENQLNKLFELIDQNTKNR